MNKKQLTEYLLKKIKECREIRKNSTKTGQGITLIEEDIYKELLNKIRKL